MDQFVLAAARNVAVVCNNIWASFHLAGFSQLVKPPSEICSFLRSLVALVS